MTEQEVVTMQRLLMLERKVALLERHFDLAGKIVDGTTALGETVKGLEHTIELMLIKNQELTEALADLQRGRQIPTERGQ